MTRYVATGAWGTRSLPAAFRQAAATYAGRTALITPDTRLTYRELDARSDAVAAGLLSSGLRPGERVLLQLTNSATAVVAWYGLLKAGLIPVCTLAIHRRLEIEQIGRKSGAVAHLVQADFPGFDLAGLAQQVAGLLPAMRQLLTIGAAPDKPGLRIEDLQDQEISDTEHAGLLKIAESLDVHGPAVLQLSGGTTRNTEDHPPAARRVPLQRRPDRQLVGPHRAQRARLRAPARPQRSAHQRPCTPPTAPAPHCSSRLPQPTSCSP